MTELIAALSKACYTYLKNHEMISTQRILPLQSRGDISLDSNYTRTTLMAHMSIEVV